MSIANSKFHKVDNLNQLISEFLCTLFKISQRCAKLVKQQSSMFIARGGAEDFKHPYCSLGFKKNMETIMFNLYMVNG